MGRIEVAVVVKRFLFLLTAGTGAPALSKRKTTMQEMRSASSVQPRTLRHGVMA